MVLMYSPYRSALYGILSLIVVSWIRKSTRMSLKDIIKTLSDGAKGSMEIAATCATAGIIVGVLTQTGLGQKFAMIIFNYSGHYLLLALIFTMLIAVILGMGMPTTAAYAISASVLAPALIREFNVPPMAAHLFIFYFACLSALTPPVALASFAAAAIASARPWDVGWMGMKFALAGFLIPYMFVYGPAMVLVGSGIEITLTIITGIVGTIALAAAVQGWLLKKASLPERILLLIAAIALIKPGWMTDVAGAAILIVVAVFQFIKRRQTTGA